LTAIKRAGADIILTYFAKEFAEGRRGWWIYGLKDQY
jgi:delta-aminolevulinic acid dehydratase/porphobilinogen synthase